jgi:hypothetical protein
MVNPEDAAMLNASHPLAVREKRIAMKNEKQNFIPTMHAVWALFLRKR